MSSIRILLADDHALFRQGIHNLLASEPDVQVIGQAKNGGEAVELANALRPDVVLMDIGMPGLSSFEATSQIKKNRPETKVLFLTMYEDDEYLMQAMQAGAGGYILKDSRAPQLIAAVRDVAQGGTHLSPRMLSHLVDDFRGLLKVGPQVARASTLTAREREVVKALAEGLSVKEIASDLDLSVKTVEVHKCNLMRKLDIHNKAQLVHYAIQKKIIQLPGVTDSKDQQQPLIHN
jgi:two-component system, NarL family, response regulator NreC